MTAAAASISLVDFIGIPYVPLGRAFTGADCWGICLLAARELFGLELPEYFYTEADILAHACEHIRHATRGTEPTRGPRWIAVDQAERARPGAIHIFRIKGFETHCGIDIGRRDFLHSLPGRNSCVESLDSILWSHCRTGAYEWIT